jgi:hypothetical protein
VALAHRDADVHQHHVVQMVDAIWAVFHQPGAHRYAVHFLDPRVPDLEGMVVVGEHTHGGPDPWICKGITVLGACLDR